jgi:hypothetical protein
MYAGSLYDTAAPSIEVRIYRNDRLLVRETCENREDAAGSWRARARTVAPETSSRVVSADGTPTKTSRSPLLSSRDTGPSRSHR